MRYVLMFIFVACVVKTQAQSTNKTTIENPDSLNATFIPFNMMAKYDIAIVNNVDHIDIINVYEPTDILIFDLNGRIVYQQKIDHRTRIDKDNFARGFYVIKTRSTKMEAIKKLYL